jgi:hypothetical protein
MTTISGSARAISIEDFSGATKIHRPDPQLTKAGHDLLAKHGVNLPVGTHLSQPAVNLLKDLKDGGKLSPANARGLAALQHQTQPHGKHRDPELTKAGHDLLAKHGVNLPAGTHLSKPMVNLLNDLKDGGKLSPENARGLAALQRQTHHH